MSNPPNEHDIFGRPDEYSEWRAWAREREAIGQPSDVNTWVSSKEPWEPETDGVNHYPLRGVISSGIETNRRKH